MRDDIHKRVPRPPKIRRWVQYALREPDRLSGRSGLALEAASREVCKEISRSFLRRLQKIIESDKSDLFNAVGGISSPRDIGGSGSAIERRILGDCQRAATSGSATNDIILGAVANALKDRSFADIRAAEPVLLPTRDQEARNAINQMRVDVGALDYRRIAAEHMGLQQRAPRVSTSISPDEDLLAPAKNGGAQ